MIIYIIIFAFILKKKSDSTPYPEGEELLVKWRIQEISEERREIEVDIPDEESVKPSSVRPVDTGNNENNFIGGFKINTDLED